MIDSNDNSLAEARSLLDEAMALIKKGNFAASLTCSYAASEYIADAYIAIITGRELSDGEDNYEVFSRMVDKPAANDQPPSEIQKLVRTISVLREAFEPTLIDETDKQDAEQMIDCVSKLLSLIEDQI